MIFRATFKTPDALTRIIQEAIADEARTRLTKNNELDEYLLRDALEHEAEACASKFVRFGEMVTIEFDTSKRTATVVML